MNWKKWRPYLISIGIALLVGTLSALITMDGMKIYGSSVAKPALTPPGWIFSVVWTMLYILMGVSAAIIWESRPGPERSSALNLYVTQLIVNFFWSLIFFNAQAFGFALIWLLLLLTLVLLMILQMRKVDKTAALLQLPYLIWLCFALYLNFGVWLLNQ